MLLAGALGGGVLVASPAGATTTTLYVSPSGTTFNADTSCSTAAYTTIQTAVDAAQAGDTVHVCAGTYDTQVTITTDGLTLTGTGTTSLIEPTFATPTVVHTADTPSSTPDMAPVIDVGPGVNGVTVQDLEVDGAGWKPVLGGCGPDPVGVLFHGASGVVQTVTVSTMELATGPPSTLQGCQVGQGIYVDETGTVASPTGTAQVSIMHDTVDGSQKNGIACDDHGTSCSITQNTVTGEGPTSGAAENGIQVGFGATGTISGNTITGSDYTGTPNSTDPQATDAAGVLLFGAGSAGTTVSGNTLTNDQIGVESVASDATIGGSVSADGNTISETGSGIPDSIGIYAVPCTIWCVDVGVATGTATTLDVSHNSLSGIPQSETATSPPAAFAAGIWVGNAAGDPTGSIAATVGDNAVSGGFLGIVFGPNTTGAIGGNTVTGFQRTGINAGSFALGGQGVNTMITDNVVTGAGAANTDPWAQNGIEIANGGTGTISGNTVTGFVYTGTSATEATAIVVFESSGVAVSGNTIEDSQVGVADQTAGFSKDSANWTMTNDSVSKNTFAYTSAYHGEGPSAGAPGTWGVWAASYCATCSVTVTISDNVLHGTGAAPGGITATGIQVGDTAVNGAAGTVSVNASGNSIAGWTTDGVANVGTTGGTVDATDNWWGSASGPYNAATNASGTGSPVSTHVSYRPWLTAPPPLYVSPNGTSTNADTSCSTAAYASIQSAVNAAVPGATVYVCAGTYTVHDVVVSKPLILRATGKATLTGTGPIFNLTDGSAGVTTVTITGFTFSNVTGRGYNGVITVGGYGAGDVTVEHNVFSRTTDEAIGYHGNHGLSGTLGKHWTIETNTISDVTGNTTARDGMFLGNLSTSIVRGNSITTTAWAGIVLTAGTTPKPGYEHNNEVVDNTVKNVPEEGIQVAFGQNDVVSGNYVDDAGMGSTTGVAATAGQVSGRNCAVCLFDTQQKDISISGNTLTNSYEGVGVGQVSVSSAIGPLGTGIAVTGNNVTGDTQFGVTNDAASGALDATGNWWGSASGPHNASTNPSGTGSPVSTHVSYRPWCIRFACSSPPPPPPPPTTPPAPPKTSTAAATGSSSSKTGTTGDVTSSDLATKTTVSGNATGIGGITVAQYTADPVTKEPFTTSPSAGYFDIEVSAGNSFTSVSVKVCSPDAGAGVDWYTGSAWEPVVGDPGPTATSGTPPCVSFTLTSSSTPSISQLTGTVFATASVAPRVTTVYGQTADATAAAELTRAFPWTKGMCPSSRAAVIATTKEFQDALSSQSLAAHLTTGTLLTPTESLAQVTATTLKDEGITTVYLVGGPLAITTAVASAIGNLTAYGCGGSAASGKIAVHRLAGTTQYGTAEAIAEFVGSASSLAFPGAYAGMNATGGTGEYNDTAGKGSSAPAGAVPTAILASGEEFQDAQAASVVSYHMALPLLLTPTSTLSTTAVAAIQKLGIKQVILMGGPLAVTGTVESALVAKTGVAVLRVAGKDYTDTARELARFEAASSTAGLGWTVGHRVMVARGNGFTDGLCGAVLENAHSTQTGAAGTTRPLLLTESPTTVGTYLTTFLKVTGHTGIDRKAGQTVTALTVLGGPLAVSTAEISAMQADLAD
jgi:putative cell wall-binding protein